MTLYPATRPARSSIADFERPSYITLPDRHSEEPQADRQALAALIAPRLAHLRPRRLRTFQAPQRLLRHPHQLFPLALFLELQAAGLVVFHFGRPTCPQGVAVTLDVDRLAVLEKVDRIRVGPDLGLARIADALGPYRDPGAFRHFRFERQRHFALFAVTFGGGHDLAVEDHLHLHDRPIEHCRGRSVDLVLSPFHRKILPDVSPFTSNSSSGPLLITTAPRRMPLAQAV